LAAQIPAWPSSPHRIADELQSLECDACPRLALTAIAKVGITIVCRRIMLSTRMHQRRDGTLRRGSSFDCTERPALPETAR
jgi:hypothetical protein